MNETLIKARVEEVVRSIMSGEQKPHKCTCNNKITLDLAKKLIEKVESKASSMGLKVVIAVADAGANPVANVCMDGAYIASYDIALNKAYTSVALKMPTSKLAELSQPNCPLYGIQFTNNGKIVVFGGGEPLYIEGKLVGGLGVSGGTLEQDTALAEYGKDVFKEILQ